MYVQRLRVMFCHCILSFALGPPKNSKFPICAHVIACRCPVAIPKCLSSCCHVLTQSRNRSLNDSLSEGILFPLFSLYHFAKLSISSVNLNSSFAVKSTSSRDPSSIFTLNSLCLLKAQMFLDNQEKRALRSCRSAS